ncbi:hypothetical protein ACED29_14430 [Shewanella sp. 5S214]|uniref:hypothetical protein n=1 Tax=Shewanella sp. 5S214 TaxID=3229999 RepID=UPI00352C4254
MQNNKTLEEFQICELEDRVEFGLCGGGHPGSPGGEAPGSPGGGGCSGVGDECIPK